MDTYKFNDTPDQQLVALALKNKEIYRHIVERYEKKLGAYIYRLSGSKKEDVEDILQEVFIKTYRNLNGYDSKLKFSSWIYRIAHNETINFLRRISSRPKLVNSEAGALIIALFKSDFVLSEGAEKKEISELVSKTVQGLDEKYKDVLILRYMEERDYREISDILKKPIGTVSILLKRAKLQLKKEIIKKNHYFKLYV